MRHFILFIALMFGLCLAAQAEDGPPPVMEFVLNDESKPPSERSIAIIFGLGNLKNEPIPDPALEQLGNDAEAYAAALKAHGSFDTILLVKGSNVSRSNMMAVFKYASGKKPPRHMYVHWAGPAIDQFTLATYGYIPGNGYGEGANVPLDLIELALYPFEPAPIVVTFDAPPASAAFVQAGAEEFSAKAWNIPNSAALSPGVGCSNFTSALTTAVNDARGRRLTITDAVSTVIRICDSAPVVHMPEGKDDAGNNIPRMEDSAAFVPLGGLRETLPVPAPLPLPAPIAVIPVPEPQPIVREDRKIPRGVGLGITSAGVLFAGIAGYEIVRYGEALDVRNTTTNAAEYSKATKQANSAVVGAGVLGPLAVGSLSCGLVFTF